MGACGTVIVAYDQGRPHRVEEGLSRITSLVAQQGVVDAYLWHNRRGYRVVLVRAR